MSILNIRLPDDLERQLAHEAQRENLPRSEVAREALRWYLQERERQRFLDELAAEARQIAPTEYAALGEEFAAAEEEALRIAEPRPDEGK